MNTLRSLICIVLWPASGLAWAAEASWYGQLGIWDYVARGSVTDQSRLDLQDDLGLRSQDLGDYLLGFRPGSPDRRWLPGLELSYVHLAAEGSQELSGLELPGPGLPPLFGGLPLLDGGTAQSTAEIDDLEVRAHWPWQLGSLMLGTGLNLTWLNGLIVVADADTGEADRQHIDQIFPSLSLSASWQPWDALRLSLSGSYLQYQGDRAQSLEASAHWRFYGPVGLEAGWRQRAYKVESGEYLVDARLSGARLGLRVELPH